MPNDASRSAWWRRLWRQNDLERQLDAELHDHLERLAADYIAAGLPEDEARRRARLEFGGLEQTKESCRDVRRLRVLDELWHDVRYAIRSLRRAPGFTAVAVVVLALGIGSGTAIFSVVDAVVLRALPFEEHNRLVAAGHWSTTQAGSLTTVSLPDFVEWRERQTAFEGLAGFRTATATVLGVGQVPETLDVLHVSPEFFDVLRVRPVLGRAFASDERLDGRGAVAVLGAGFWQRQHGGASDVLGRSITVDGTPHEIIGVAPPGFSYPVGTDTPTEVIVPLALAEEERAEGRSVGITVSRRTYLTGIVGRLQDDVSFERAAADMDRLGGAIVPLHEHVVGLRMRAWMRLLLGAVLCVLLLVCANVANLLLARASTRDRELGIRAALGAGRWRLVRQLLVEAFVLSAAGTTAGIALAWWGAGILRVAMPDGIPRAASIALDLRVLLVTGGAALIVGLLVGMLPAVRHSRPNLARALSDSARSATASRTRQRFQRSLVVAELALAVTLLVGAGLFVTSFAKLVRVDLGFDSRGVLTAAVEPQPGSAAGAAGEISRELLEIADRAQRVPGVERAAVVAGSSPMATRVRTFARIAIPGRTLDPPDAEVALAAVTAGYHRALNIPLRSGRYFSFSERRGEQTVALLSEEAARRYFPNEDPVGTTVAVFDSQMREIVGVVGDVRSRPDEAPQPLVYIPLIEGFVFARTGTIVIRSEGDREPVVEGMRSAVSAVMPGVRLDVQVLEEIVGRRTAQQRVSALLLGLFGIVGLVIASVGVYGVMASVTMQRMPEIGVRLAMGATRAQVMWMILRQAAALAACGLALGTAAAWTFSATAEAFLFDLAPTDPRVFAGAVLVLAAFTCLAATLPAWRAATIDPLAVLRRD